MSWMSTARLGSVTITSSDVRANTESKSNEAYSILKGRILDNTYGPGYRIVIAELSRETGLSNAPVREAIRRLEAEGWIEVQPNVGARVLRFSERDHRHTMQLLARLEALATVHALPHLTEADIAEARRINQEMLDALQDFDPGTFNRMNGAFHAVIYAKCPDTHLRSLLEAELQRFAVIRRSILRTIPGRARESINEHENLLRLIESKAPADEIEAVARQHKLNGLHPDEGTVTPR